MKLQVIGEKKIEIEIEIEVKVKVEVEVKQLEVRGWKLEVRR